MANYTWEENRKDIFDYLPRKEKIVPGPSYCLLHDKELKKTYSGLETALRGNVLPWLIEKEIHKVMAENVCCCPPSKRNKKAHYANIPKEISELKHWKTYENTLNQLNNSNSAFPQQARPSLNRILELHLKQNIPHYEIFLNMLLDYIERPYQDYFELKVEAGKDIEEIFGPGDFLLQIFQHKYNARVLYLKEDQMLGFIVAARSFADFKKIKSYIVKQVEDDGFLDALSGNLSTSATYAHTCNNQTRKKQLIKKQVRNFLGHKKDITQPEIYNFNSSQSKQEHRQMHADVVQKRLITKHQRLKRCGCLKADKQDVSFITNIELKEPVKASEVSKECVYSEELEMLKILMGEEVENEETEKQRLNTNEEDIIRTEELKMLQIMIGDEESEKESEKKLPVSQLFENFRFGQRKEQKDKHRVELKINLVSNKNNTAVSQNANSLIKTEVNFQLSCNPQEKQKVSKVPVDYKRYYSNHFWVLLLLYFTLLGLCISCIS